MYEQTAVEIEIGGVTTRVTGVRFNGPKASWGKVVMEWGEDALQKSKDAGLDVEADNYILLRIEMPCGETARFKTLDDVPRVTTPCPCGNSGCYLIEYADPIRAAADEVAFLAGVAIDAVAEAAGRMKSESHA